MQVSVFDKAAEMFSGDSCKMASLVGTKSCQEVHVRLQKVRNIRQAAFQTGQTSALFIMLQIPAGLEHETMVSCWRFVQNQTGVAGTTFSKPASSAQHGHSLLQEQNQSNNHLL